MRKLGYGYVNLSGVRIQYYRTGEEKPPVILLHGALENALCWNRFPLVLEPIYDVVLVDARGHGFSGAPESGYGPDNHADDVIGLIDALKLVRPVLIGHSIGAETAAVVASRHQELIKAIILEDPPWPYEVFGATEELRMTYQEKLRQKILDCREKTVDELMGLCKAEHPDWDESEYFQWAKGRKQVKPQMASGVNDNRKRWDEIISNVSCPGLLITGEISRGGLISPEISKKIESLWESCQVVQIPEAGHHIHREQYRPFQDIVRHYLRALRRG
jgi:N-formylmaleamate deformylase